MKIKNPPKSHYELVTKFLKMTSEKKNRLPDNIRESIAVPDFYELMDKVSEKWGPYPTYEQFFMAGYDWVNVTGKTAGSVTYEANVMYHLYNMIQNGEHIYYVTTQLAAKLAQTNINVETYFLKSPFREIYVQIDPGLFTMHDVDGTETPVHGFYVYLNDLGHIKDLRIMVVSVMEPQEGIPFNDSGYYFHLELPSGKIRKTVKDVIDENLRTKEVEINMYGGHINLDYMEEFTYFVLNTLLYLTSKDPDVIRHFPIDLSKKIAGLKNPAKVRKELQRAERSTSLPIFIAGASLTSNSKDIEDIRRAGSIGKWKLQNKILVSGHYRKQWYGSKVEDNRRQELIWIDPYEKGPDAGELMSRKIQVGK